MGPIILTELGETLLPYPGAEAGEDVRLQSCIGVHDICRGWVDIVKASSTHRAIHCRVCGLRVVIPNAVERWSQLAKHFAQFNKPISYGVGFDLGRNMQRPNMRKMLEYPTGTAVGTYFDWTVSFDWSK